MRIRMRINWTVFLSDFSITKRQEGMREIVQEMVLWTYGYMDIFFYLKCFLLYQEALLMTHVCVCCSSFKRDLLLSCLELRNQEICHHQIIILVPKMMTLLRPEPRSLAQALTYFSRMVPLQLLEERPKRRKKMRRRFKMKITM